MLTVTCADLAVVQLQGQRAARRGRFRPSWGLFRVSPWSYAYLATQRTPLPHISASLPSALNMRIRTSATSEGRIRISPSPPMPKCRSETLPPAAAGSATVLLKAVDVDVIVADAVHLGESHRRIV